MIITEVGGGISPGGSPLCVNLCTCKFMSGALFFAVLGICSFDNVCCISTIEWFTVSGIKLQGSILK